MEMERWVERRYYFGRVSMVMCAGQWPQCLWTERASRLPHLFVPGTIAEIDVQAPDVLAVMAAHNDVEYAFRRDARR